MAKAYTPGLKVAARTLHRVRRSLPIAGEVLVPSSEPLLEKLDVRVESLSVSYPDFGASED